MKRLFPLVAVLFLAACDPDGYCQALTVGQSIDGLPVTAPGSWQYAIGYKPQGGSSFDTGPAFDHQCCASMNLSMRPLAGCDYASLQCSGGPYVGVTIVTFLSPYTYEHGYDDSQICYAAVKDRRIVAVWSRRWS